MAHIEHKVSEEYLSSLPIQGGKPKSEKEEKHLREICLYEFNNIEEPGLSVQFPYGSTKRFHKFTFFHGGKYRVPRFLARFLESRSTPIYDWRPDPDGTGIMRKELIGQKSRFQMRELFE